MSIEGQGHFFTIYFQVLYVLCFTRPRYQVGVYRTIGPLVCKFATELLPLIDVRIRFLHNIFRTNFQNKTKFCIHIIIDNVVIVYICFSQICNKVMEEFGFLLNNLRTN